MHVLVVDDDAAGRYLLESILRSADHRVTSARDGAEALEMARAEIPDVVISDILMPHMDGYQLCREWKADPALAEVPIAFYTASYTDVADERFALDLGVDAFWRKPMDPQKLLNAVADLARVGDRAEVRTPELTDEADVLKQYNARLVGKLEEKAAGLERANEELRHAMDLLAHEVTIKEGLIEELNGEMLELERTESELRRERDFSRQILLLADLFVCILDADLNITLFSEGAERITGRSAGDLGDADAVELLVASDARDEVRDMFAGAGGPGIVKRTIPIVTAGGDVRMIECAISATPSVDGSQSGFNIFGVDVTERMRMEQVKSDFIQVVSHELRTPLTSIIGFVDLLGSLPPERLVDQAPTISERLRQNSDRMRQLVEELLEVNAIAVEGVNLTVRPVDLGVVVRRSAEAVFRGAEHVLTVAVEPGIPQVMCDGERIGRVVTNLVSNAVKYSPKGGAIEVCVARDGDEVLVSVTDEGVGIPPDKIPTLFVGFSQGDMSSTRRFGGIGLGLYIVDEIIRAHGGRVDVASIEGHGSTFIVRIPLRTS